LPRHKIPTGSASAVPVLGFPVVQFVLCHETLQWRDLRLHVDHQFLAEEKCLMLHKKKNHWLVSRVKRQN